MKWYDYIMWRGNDDSLFPIIIVLLTLYILVWVVAAVTTIWRNLK